jgi:hypothetical protein
MGMITIRLPSAAHAGAVSRGLWLLSRPEQVNGAQDTQILASWDVQKDGTALLIIDPNTTLPIHPAVVAQITDPADKDGSQAQMAALLGPLLADPASGLAAAAGLIAKGGVLAMGDLLPLIKPALVEDHVPPVRTAP